ncbi:MAG: FAD-dependent oxidoreductase [Chloroflexi bacterium]|nr:FAD-dependent oxidoreductase [Chloroflexota bacterium]MBU1749320.1 FAD-dependent oxidoreductase [Chloroflexota bacterium]
MTEGTKPPAALVIGAGIAGIQAALDIADAGFQVYLVEREPSVGGHMSQLDKTFPTLDCSACILTPKMVDVARHPNIELMTYAEVLDVAGDTGTFRARVLKKARYVDLAKCTGCDDCTKVCPVAVPSEFNLELSDRRAIYVPFPQAVPNKYTIDKRGWPPCKDACPAHIDVQGYVALIGQEKFAESLALIRRTIPFPGVIGRVCNHPCETACNRDEFDQSIAICALKRFVADVEGEPAPLPAIETHRDQTVAIVGAGPAGLTAAHDLALLGYGVTVYEALPVAGGMLAVGIPEYRLPRDVLNREIARIEALGVEIRLNTPVGGAGGPSLADLRRDHDAVFVGVGAHQERELDVQETGPVRVVPGAVFLRELNLGRPMAVGRRVAVVGGGNVAIDAARSALRLGAESVTVVYRRSRAEMPASAWEIEDAEEEGVRILFLANPVCTLDEGESGGLQCVQMELGAPDASGRRQPIPIPDSDFALDVDMVIPAIGQVPDLGFMAEEGELPVARRGTLTADPDTLATAVPGVFAGGDAVTGPATAIEAIAAGSRAARNIHRYLQGEELAGPAVGLPVVPLADVDLRRARKQARAVMPKLALDTRAAAVTAGDAFTEVELGLNEEQAVAEALRCLNCGVCSECRQCEVACQPGAINHDMRDEMVDLDVGTVVVATGFDPFNAQRKPEFGYGRYPNVISGLQFERLASASGPTAGKIKLNGKEPQEIVFIHCVGSRDKQCDAPYCSRICCMYTAKQAHLAHDKVPGAKITVFYMDVRAFGKGFEEFYDRVRGEGITYRRGNPSEIYKRGDKLVVRAEDTLLGRTVEVPADLVVLATGVQPRADAGQVAEMLGLARSEDGFFTEAHPELRPVDTQRPGVFLAGTCQAPKDIPDTVAQAKAAAARAIVTLSRLRRETRPDPE